MSSFICENTASFVLVNQLTKILSQYWINTIPLHFWNTREGSNLSRSCNPSTGIKILALFPRRPKVSSLNQTYIEVKFNESLFPQASLLNKAGISVIGGIPLVSNIFDLNLNAQCMWFNFVNSSDQDIFFSIDLENKTCIHSFRNQDAIIPVSDVELIDHIDQNCRLVLWRDVIDILKRVRNYQVDYYHFGSLFGATYKPIYFILKN